LLHPQRAPGRPAPGGARCAGTARRPVGGLRCDGGGTVRDASAAPNDASRRRSHPPRGRAGERASPHRAARRASSSPARDARAACGATAAELFGMRLPRRTTRAGGAAIHLEVERGSAPRRTALLVVHRRAPSATLGLHGVTMVEPLIALQQIAGRLTHQELVV